MSARIISIDPGVRRVAYAEWSIIDGSLLRAGLIDPIFDIRMPRVEQWRKLAWQVGLELRFDSGLIDLVIEMPQIYAGIREEDPNDLIDLAGVVGAISGNLLCGSVVWSPLPREWKGQAPKSVTKLRVDKRLPPEAKNRIYWPAKSLCHNVYDAIHLGLVYLEDRGILKIPYGERFVKNT